MRMRGRGWVGGVLLGLLAPALAGEAQVVKVELRNAGGPDIARELQRALGAPVEVRGGLGRTVTLTLATGSPVLTLDRVAAQLSGTWRMKLRVRAGREAPPAARPVLERNLAIGIRDVAALRAFGVIARELRADLEAEGALDTPVTLAPDSEPATVLLDRIAEQAGASWSVRYVIEAPDAPPPPEPRERDLEVSTAAGPGGPVRAAPPRLASPPIMSPQTPTGFRKALQADLYELLRADPARRGSAVRDFVHSGQRRVAALASLTPAERRARIQAARPLLIHWRRMYQGLAPEVQRELQPASAFLEQALR